MSNANPLTKYHYNETTRKAVAVFGNLFNRLYIARADGKGNYKHERVPLSYSPREKFLARIRDQRNIDDKRIAIRLPRMAFEISGIQYDSQLQLNKKNKILRKTEDGFDLVWQSVPYTLTFDLTLYSRGTNEVYQMMEQILPIFSPNYFVTVEDIETPNKKTDIPIELSGISEEDSYDGSFDNDRRVVTRTLTFEMKVKYSGWIRKRPIILTSEVNTFLQEIDKSEDPDIITTATEEENGEINVTITEKHDP